MARQKKATSESGITNEVTEKVDQSKKKKTTKKNIGSCFVLMPFSEPFNTYYKTIIKPAVNNAKLDSFRGDSLFRPSPIMADIWQMIQDAKLLVAELTGKNPNVFYELGLAHAIGKPVVLLSETIEDVPFDLQSLRVIIYDKNDPSWGNKLKIKLTKAINETTNSPVDSVPQMFRKTVKSQAPADTGLASRISALERRLALRDLETENISPALADDFPNNIAEIRERFHMIKSDREAEYAVRRALSNGMPPQIVERFLREVMPISNTKRIMMKFGFK